MKLLKAENLSLNISTQRGNIFKNQSISIEKGETIALVGPSGCGKTLFLRSLCLLEPRTQGSLTWKGTPLSNLDIPNYRSQAIYIGQETLNSNCTVKESFQEVFRFKANCYKSWDIALTLDALKYLNKPIDFIYRPIRHLSGGEKQIVNILRAIALQPELLCLDEPTSALDDQSSKKLELWLKQNYKEAWIWVTHQPDQTYRIANSRVIFSSSNLLRKEFLKSKSI